MARDIVLQVFIFSFHSVRASVGGILFLNSIPFQESNDLLPKKVDGVVATYFCEREWMRVGRGRGISLNLGKRVLGYWMRLSFTVCILASCCQQKRRALAATLSTLTLGSLLGP